MVGAVETDLCGCAPTLTVYIPPFPLDAVEPLALGEYGTVYVVAFALISVAAQQAVRYIEQWCLASVARRNEPPTRDNLDAVEDVALFLAEQVFSLLKLMFAALSGRYIVNLFATARDDAGYVLFIVVSAVVLLKLAEHAARREANRRAE